MIRTIRVLGLFSLMAASTIFAQTASSVAPRLTHKVQLLATMLDLTPAQQEQATSIFLSARSNLGTLRRELITAHQDLKTAIENNDAATIEQTSASIGSLTTQFTAARAKAAAAFRLILTPDQKAKLSQFQSHNRGLRRRQIG